ncbi:cinnamoyl-CoA reductase 1-like isoform X3 [Typha angustifolia]|uniref:cinnamoyl-CoA reductase 1-like isoform X3 n=1 Tax=Typha angustifolia TaxID=59011 RepID=UPI003C30C4CC
MEAMGEKKRVCVTGAGGFVASWLVKLLLSKGYIVHGTVRDPSDEKNNHLKKLDNASENLLLFKADVLDYNNVVSAIAGCEGVFHVACPVPSTKVPNPENWYCLAKTLAESEALEYAEKNGLDVVTVLPCMVIGPMLQSTVNASSLFLINVLKGARESVENSVRHLVDVRDVADALLLMYEKPDASGRHICASHSIRMRDMVDMLKSLYPNYKYPKNFTEAAETAISSRKLQMLGWKCRPLEESFVDSVECYQAAGLLNGD